MLISLAVVLAVATPTFATETHFNCTPGETFQMDCNTCKCSPDGRSAGCTLMACPVLPSSSPAPPASEKQDSQFNNCTPGEMFTKDCNTCVCSPDGTSAGCTDIACSLSLPQEPATDFNCIPGKTYKVECNTCICSKDGKTASCTAMACPPLSLESSQEPHSPIPASESHP